VAIIKKAATTAIPAPNRKAMVGLTNCQRVPKMRLAKNLEIPSVV
jgi:hypothetical protein